MAGGARIFVAERSMHERLHQLRLRRLMWIMAAQTIGFVEWLIVVCFLKAFILGVVAVEAELRSGLRQVIVKLSLSFFTGLVSRVAGAATHIERSMTASVLRNV